MGIRCFEFLSYFLINFDLFIRVFHRFQLKQSLLKTIRPLAVPFWIVERAREIAESASCQQRGETGTRRKKREETGGEAGGKGTALLAVIDAFEFPVAPATENSDWSTNNRCCQTNLKSNQLLHTFGGQSIAWIWDHVTWWLRSRKKIAFFQI